MQKARDKAESDRQKEERRVAKAQQRDTERAAKQQQREATKPKQLPRPALAGSSVFNVTPLPRAAMRQVCCTTNHLVVTANLFLPGI